MQNIRNSVLGHLRIGKCILQCSLIQDGYAIGRLRRHMCASTSNSSDQLMERVIGIVKKFDRIDANMVTEIAHFQKDLSLDSLDRVELVMAIEQEFSIEIPDKEADKLTCCADVAKYIASGSEGKVVENS